MMQMMPSYYRIMAGAKSVFAQEFLEGGFIAANWNIDQDLTHDWIFFATLVRLG